MMNKTDHDATDKLLSAFLRKHDPARAPSNHELAVLTSSIMGAAKNLQVPRDVSQALELVPFWKLQPTEMLRGLVVVLIVMAMGYTTGSHFALYSPYAQTSASTNQISYASWHNFMTVQPSTGEVYYDNN